MIARLVALGLAGAGAVLCLTAAVGVVRMPDLLTRMQAATKASSLGVTLVLLGAAVELGHLEAWVRVLAIVAFLLLTVPIAAHLIARAAYHQGTPLYERTEPDELAGRYVAEQEAPEGVEDAEGADTVAVDTKTAETSGP